MYIAKKVLVVLLTLSLTVPSFAETIHIVPGPLDGCKIITPWGDYIAVQNGSTVWVGTEAEYEHVRIGSILEQNGMREVKLEDVSEPNVHAIVSTKQPYVLVGGVHLYQIDSRILFGIGPDKKLHRPPKPTNTEYVSVTWLQSEKASITPRLYDHEGKKTFNPFDTDVINGIHISEFMIPKPALTHKVGLIFAHKKSKPGYLQFASLSQTHYKSIMDSVEQSQRLNIPVYKTDVTDLPALHELDPSIPAELDSSIPIKEEVDYEKLPYKGCPMPPNPKGKKISDRQLGQIYTGMTVDQVIKRFGNPIHCSHWDNGSSAYSWKRSSGKGGQSSVIFDANGTVAATGGDAD